MNTCPECDGEGIIYFAGRHCPVRIDSCCMSPMDCPTAGARQETCPECDGAGYVEDEE